ncbi:MAG: UDP-N-acetylglucosamine 2-epimerase (non-hydrolyzing), partial [Gemmatimonadota bacterium]|nr:UDP-N-acetylglucosamine 2-epimerase (non-hydrolyzing) [Gemmatimonadota bacterium]
MNSRARILLLIGTRPEAIKLAPVYRELSRHDDLFEPLLVTTSQHSEMLRQALASFHLSADADLGLMRHGQGIEQFLARSLKPVALLVGQLQPAAVVVQGDTTTVVGSALSAFYQRTPVAHVEAGLRSFDSGNPFPEEIHRRITACIADVHFAPTQRARANLLNEGVKAETVYVTGNTIVDALQSLPSTAKFEEASLDAIDFDRSRVLLVTAHRRESHGEGLHSICTALRRLVEKFSDLEIVF